MDVFPSRRRARGAANRQIEPIEAIEKNVGQREVAPDQGRVFDQRFRQQYRPGPDLKRGRLAVLPCVDMQHREIDKVLDAVAHRAKPGGQGPYAGDGGGREETRIETPALQSRRVDLEL